MLRKVYLHGLAGRVFGKVFELDVASLGEAVRALAAQLPGFTAFIEQNDFHVVRGKRATGFNIGPDDIGFRLGKGDLHITPTISLSKKGKGLGKIIAGVLLIGTAWFAAPFLGATASAAIMSAGTGLALTGASSLLSKNKSKSDDKEKTSGTFGNSPQIAEQGICVPVIYGRMRTQLDLIISASITSADVAA